MKVTYLNHPGKLMNLGAYLRFASDDEVARPSITIEPDYSLDFGPEGMSVTGYVRARGKADTFRIKTFVFMYDVNRP